MAGKRGGDQGGGNDSGKLKFFYAELAGNNQTLQDALKGAFQAIGASPVVVQRLGNGNTAVAAISAPNGEDVIDVPDEAMETDAAANAQTSTKPRGSGPKKDRNAGIEPVADINFMPEGKPSLKDFFAEKAPASDMDQILVMVYYMQNKISLPQIGLGHILSAFKDVKKTIPVDMRGTIRNMKKQKVWLSFTKMDAIRTTTQGDNAVEFELGKSKKT